MAYRYQQYQFLLTSTQESAQIYQCLENHVNIHLSGHKKFSRTFYDTFDWRLYSTNTSFYAEQIARQYSLHSKDIITGDSLMLTQQSKMPRFAWDVADTMFHKALSKKLSVRALLPVLKTEVEQSLFELCNEENKMIAKMILETCRLKKHSATSKDQYQYFIVVPLRGFNEQVEQLLPMIIKLLPVQPNSIDLQKNIMQQLAIEPFPYTTKIKITLSAKQSTEISVKFLLQHIFNMMLTNEAGLKENIDSEFLHDFRVAVRRIRTALSRFKALFPIDRLNFFKEEFAWLGNITSPVRDLDVHLLAFASYQQELPKKQRDDLLPLQAFLHKHHKIEQRKLVTALNSKRYQQLKNNWQKFLTDEQSDANDIASQATKTYATQAIWKAYRRVLKSGNAITRKSPPDDYHELRKDGKKLRYLLEFFQSLYPSNKMQTLVTHLKQLQDQLGKFQDMEVQSMAMEHLAQQMQAEGKTPEATIQAMHTLSKHMLIQKQQVLNQFAKHYSNFTQKKYQAIYLQLFKQSKN